MEVIKYDNQYQDELEEMLKDFSKEIFGYGTADIDAFVKYHWAIYLAKKGDEVIGFSSFIYNTYYGLRPPTIGQTYLYVRPEHRRGRASYLLSKQAGYISIDSGLPLENYYASESSERIGNRMQGTLLYKAYIYEPEEVAKAYNKLKL